MTHQTVNEWGRVDVGEKGFSRPQADALLAAARAHPSGGREGTAILSDHHRHLTARQTVGVLAGRGCSLEILPKVDPEAPDENAVTVRSRLVHMLDVALGLELSAGAAAEMARQSETLLDILIRLFADRLLAEARRGLPRRYDRIEDDLPTLRGRLNVVRQFTTNAVRPDRLACQFDTLTSDTPLLQIMKACVVFLSAHAKSMDTQRKLAELRFLLSDVSDVPARDLPWKLVGIDRTNRRWKTLFDLARLFLRRDWQATHHDPRRTEGVTLLFPMNDLFESYVAALLRRALSPLDLQVVAQGGLRHCLGDWSVDAECRGQVFQTKPDILIRRRGEIVGVVDTKWKRLSADPLDRKHGVSQQDVYQLMAYARLYRCERLMLLYPAAPSQQSGVQKSFGIDGGRERLDIATIDIVAGRDPTVADLQLLALGMLSDRSSGCGPKHMVHDNGSPKADRRQYNVVREGS